MLFVIDSNLLEDLKLRAFLAKSSSHIAVLTDYVGLEASSGASVKIVERMSILRDFHRQVCVLKGTRRLFNVHPRTAGLRRRLVDQEQTNQFLSFIRNLERLPTSPAMARQLEQRRVEANRVKQDLAAYAGEYGATLQSYCELYSGYELESLRSKQIFPVSATKKVQRHIADVCYLALQRHGVRRPQSTRELFNHYAFRHALCWHLLEIERLARGTIKVKPENHANDIADLHIVTCATYFDGFLSNDHQAKHIHSLATSALQELNTHN